jgi:hypothetical protein
MGFQQRDLQHFCKRVGRGSEISVVAQPMAPWRPTTADLYVRIENYD